jgi:gas vesicle protein
METADFAPWLIGWFVTALVGGVGAYFGAYLSKKGENLATKEDVKEITTLQEEVKHDFQMLGERMKAIESMRMAVIERRFHAHQEAYSLWLKLLRIVHKDGAFAIIKKCEDWWEENNLYLDESVRAPFKIACFAAYMHPELLAAPRTNENANTIRQNWADIQKLGPLIEAAVNLPSIGVLAEPKNNP